ncbi:MAG TPA: exodeoxyribonuclease V subunit alpha [Spirochaetota bacterium]|nr:exodeoxyribonuclease V subunit alpha [Spirochaetota bacterium]
MKNTPDLFENYSINELMSTLMENREIDYLDISTIKLISGFTGKKDYGLNIILIAMFISLNQGSSSLKLKIDSLSKKLYFIDESNLKDYYNSFLNNLKKNNYSDIIGKNGDFKPIIYDNNNLYFHKYFVNEQKLKTIINDRIKSGYNVNEDSEKIITIIGNVFNQSKIDLDIKQKIAIINSIIMDFFIISGGPGTGKTTIITVILIILLRLGYNKDDINILSPTGRSAIRVTESIQTQLNKNFSIQQSEKESISSIEAKTIHRLLKYNPINKIFTYNENNFLPTKVLIIDEVSMVDLVLMRKLMTALSKDAKIIFVGDKNQLPSVEAGSVLNELIPKNNIESFDRRNIDFLKQIIPDLKIIPADKIDKLTNHFIILDKPYRYDGNIHQIAERINNNYDPDKLINSIRIVNDFFEIVEKRYDNENCFLINASENRDRLNDLLEKWFTRNFLNNKEFIDVINIIAKNNLKQNSSEIEPHLIKLLNIIENSKILTFLREGLFGCNSINDFIKKIFLSEFGSLSGIPIIITKNDYNKNIYNGDIGVIVKDNSFKNYCLFKILNKIKIFDIKYLEWYEEAFAITIHKSQGSEYNDVILIFPSDVNNKLLKKELVYTGITRAKKSCLIYSSKIILKKALTNKIERESGFDFWEQYE